jgi:hypothetical protein
MEDKACFWKFQIFDLVIGIANFIHIDFFLNLKIYFYLLGLVNDAIECDTFPLRRLKDFILN